MLKSWLNWINISLAILSAVILIAAGAVIFLRSSEIPHFEGPIRERSLPSMDAGIDKSAYDAISNGPLQLAFTSQSIQLPDLKKNLVYLGKNGRPDAQLQSPLLHFSFTGNKGPASIPPNQPVYIKYDKKQNPPQYVFSPGNAETPLWIEITPHGNQVSVNVGMLNDKGELINEPKANAQFTLTEKENIRPTTNAMSWELGKLRVDGTLLARQKARWYGTDKFLEKHGGSEYAHLIGKQRIDFGEGETPYSIYVGPGDSIIWDGTRWKVAKPGPETLGHPLMSIKKIDDRLMSFELWDAEGKNKITLNLLKSTEGWVPQNIQAFKFVGARTRTQFVFEINKERILLSPQDWLLLIDNNWKKLTTPEEIDAYVERKTIGPLFVFDGVEKKDDKQVMQGTLFNSTRTDTQSVEIPMQQSNKKDDTHQKPVPKPSNEKQEPPQPANLPSQELMRGRPVEE